MLDDDFLKNLHHVLLEVDSETSVIGGVLMSFP